MGRREGEVHAPHNCKVQGWATFSYGWIQELWKDKRSLILLDLPRNLPISQLCFPPECPDSLLLQMASSLWPEEMACGNPHPAPTPYPV